MTIGSLLPFDRLVRAADQLASAFPNETFRAQIGEGAYAPVNMPFDRFLSAKAFSEAVADCRLIVAHAGMGSLLTAAEAGKPIVVMPRRLAFDEISTDHQVATARRLGERPGVYLAMDETELRSAIERALAEESRGAGLATRTPAPFLQRIKEFIHQA